MSCIPGREVAIRLRDKRTGHVREPSVVCPAKWTRGRLLSYCRSEHPEATVRIVAWHPIGGWDARLWIVNPPV